MDSVQADLSKIRERNPENFIQISFHFFSMEIFHRIENFPGQSTIFSP